MKEIKPYPNLIKVIPEDEFNQLITALRNNPKKATNVMCDDEGGRWQIHSRKWIYA